MGRFVGGLSGSFLGKVLGGGLGVFGWCCLGVIFLGRLFDGRFWGKIFGGLHESFFFLAGGRESFFVRRFLGEVFSGVEESFFSNPSFSIFYFNFLIDES